MLKKIFLFHLMMVLSMSTLQAQADLDSLRQAWEQTPDDSIKASLGVQLAWEYQYKNLDSLYWFAQQALSLSKTQGYLKLQSLAYKRLAIAHEEWAEWDSAIYRHQQSEALERQLQDSTGLTALYINLGNLYRNFNRPTQTLAALKKAQLFASKGDTIRQARIYLQQSIAYEVLAEQRPPFAIAYLDTSLGLAKRALKIFQGSKNLISIANCYNSLGNIYDKRGNYTEAKRYHELGLALAQVIDRPFILAQAYNNLGIVHSHLHQFDSARLYYDKALVIHYQINDSMGQAKVFDNIGDLFFEQENYDSAYNYLTKALNSTISLLNSETTDLQWQNMIALTKTLLEKKRDLDQTIDRQKQTLMNVLIITGLALVIALLVIFIYRQRFRAKAALVVKDQQLHRQELQLKNQKIDELIRDRELERMGAVLKGQEEERQRIAEDLHDRLGSLLATVKFHFTSVEDQLTQAHTQDQEQYQKANQLLDDACQEVRKIAHNITSSTLAQFGLVAALEDLRDTIASENKMTFELITKGLDHRLNSALEIGLYRIIQELVSNILKHAQASRIVLQLVRHNGDLTLSVEDNGLGFDAQATHEGMGLQNMASRVHQLQGELNIDSTRQKGTTIFIDIPVPS